MKFKTVIYVTKDNTPGVESWAEKKYDEQFNRIDGTVENEEEWNKFWTDVKTNLVDNIDTSPYFIPHFSHSFYLTVFIHHQIWDCQNTHIIFVYL